VDIEEQVSWHAVSHLLQKSETWTNAFDLSGSVTLST
jgi:hypothetical protein